MQAGQSNHRSTPAFAKQCISHGELSRPFAASGVQAQAEEALPAQDGAQAAAVQVPGHQDLTGMSRPSLAAYRMLSSADSELTTDIINAVVVVAIPAAKRRCTLFIVCSTAFDMVCQAFRALKRFTCMVLAHRNELQSGLSDRFSNRLVVASSTFTPNQPGYE